jgi:hypothetical protein
MAMRDSIRLAIQSEAGSVWLFEHPRMHDPVWP